MISEGIYCLDRSVCIESFLTCLFSSPEVASNDSLKAKFSKNERAIKAAAAQTSFVLQQKLQLNRSSEIMFTVSK